MQYLEIKKNSDVYWKVWTNIKKLYARNNIFEKNNSKDEILNHLYFGPNFVFLGTVLRCFSQRFFLNIFRQKTMVADIISQFQPLPPTLIKTFSILIAKMSEINFYQQLLARVCSTKWEQNMKRYSK